MPQQFDPKKIALIGVPSSIGARQNGQELTPFHLRKAGLIERLRTTGKEILDFGDLDPVPFRPDPTNHRAQNLQPLIGVLRQVSGAVDKALRKHARPLVIGGDCTISIGIVAALRNHVARLGMIYLDGDLDLNTPETTESGIFDGMVLAHLLGRGATELCEFGSHYPLVDVNKVTLFGYSVASGGIDPVELQVLEHIRANKFPIESIRDDVGMHAARALQTLEARVDGFFLHFDVDVIDFAEFPAADLPHKAGLAFADARSAFKTFLQSPKCAAIAVTEFNALRDRDGKLAEALIDTLVAAIA